MQLTLAARTRHMNPSIIREILKLTDRPGVLSLAGGLPAPEGFPIEALSRASERVWHTQGAAAMQYATSEGLPALREWVAQRLSRPDWRVSSEQVLITTGSQQGLDLVGKVLLDPGCTLLLEQPTFLGALQAFSAYEPVCQPWFADAEGPLPQALGSVAAPNERGVRAAYLVPDFQNPTGHCLSAARRMAIATQAQQHGVALIEDNPYGDLWFDAPPPAPLASMAPEHTVYLGSMSKVLAPGLRLGFAVTPAGEGGRALHAKLLHAKQAADLHTPGFNQRLVHQLLQDGFDLDAHIAQVRNVYRVRRDAMAAALVQHMPDGCTWAMPSGGMFYWVHAPQGWDAMQMLPSAVAAGVAYVPGSAFYSDAQSCLPNTLRLSFVTLSEDQIHEAVGRLGRCMYQHLGSGC